MNEVASYIAYCWPTGLIEFSEAEAKPHGAIEIARGKSVSALKYLISGKARIRPDGELFVPGYAEAHTLDDKLVALKRFCGWVNAPEHRFCLDAPPRQTSPQGAKQ